MIKVNVAWNREASEIAEEQGWEVLHSGNADVLMNEDEYLVYDIKEFETEAEANAYIAGIHDSNGWDNPYYELIKP